MRIAICALLIGIMAPAGVSLAAEAAPPAEQIVVVKASAIDGLAGFKGRITETRTAAYSFDGREYSIDESVLSNLDGVQTLLLVDHRRDSIQGRTLTKRYWQEVRALDDTYFEVEDIPGKVLWFQVATVDGRLGLLGDCDQILCPGGEDGPYHIWKIESIGLVDREALHIR